MEYVIAFYIWLALVARFAPAGSLLQQWGFRVWKSLSQHLNTLSFDHEDQTFSGRSGRNRALGWRFWTLIAFAIDRVALLFGDRDHCVRSIEPVPHVDKLYSARLVLIFLASAVVSVLLMVWLVREALAWLI